MHAHAMASSSDSVSREFAGFTDLHVSVGGVFVFTLYVSGMCMRGITYFKNV